LVYKEVIPVYSSLMISHEYFVTFPDGDELEIAGPLATGAIVDVNAVPFELPLGSIRTLAYRIAIKRTAENKGNTVTRYTLEQLSAEDLLEYT